MHSPGYTTPPPLARNLRNTDTPLHSRPRKGTHCKYWCIICHEGRDRPDCGKHPVRMWLLGRLLIPADYLDRYPPDC